MKSTGFVIEPREIMSNEWYTEPNTMHLYRHCRLRANYADARWRGIELKRGQFVTSLNTLSEETGLTVKQVRLAIQKLEATGYVASKSTNKNRIITVLNYDSEQQEVRQTGSRQSGEGQPEGTQKAADNNNNKENNNNKYYSRESNRSKNCSYDIKELMKIDTLDFVDDWD